MVTTQKPLRLCILPHSVMAVTKECVSKATGSMRDHRSNLSQSQQENANSFRDVNCGGDWRLQRVFMSTTSTHLTTAGCGMGLGDRACCRLLSLRTLCSAYDALEMTFLRSQKEVVSKIA